MGDVDPEKLTDDDWWAINLLNRASERMARTCGSTEGMPDVLMKRFLASVLVELRQDSTPKKK